MENKNKTKLMPDVKNDGMRRVMGEQLKSYQGFSARAAELLAQHGTAPHDATFFEKLPAEMGMAFSRMTDTSDQKRASLS